MCGFFFFLRSFVVFTKKKEAKLKYFSIKYDFKHGKQDISQKSRSSTKDATGMCLYIRHRKDYTVKCKSH